MKIIRKICSLLVAVSTAFAGIGSAIYCPSLLTEASYLDYTSNEIIDVPVVVSEQNDNEYYAYSESTADKVLGSAESYVGWYGPSNIFTNYWNIGAAPWCAMFVVYILEKNGIMSGESTYIRTPYVDFALDGENYIPGFRDWFEKRQRFVYSYDSPIPDKCDLIIFREDDNYYHGGHVGFVKSVNLSNRTVQTIEGNTGNNAVAVKEYKLSDSRILGYCKMSISDDNSNYALIKTSISTTTTTTTTTTTSVQTFTTTAVTIAETASEVTSAVIPETTAHVTTTAPSYTVPDTFRFNRYYISSLIGANLRSECQFGDNILRVLDTDDRVIVKYYINDFAFVEVEKTGEIGFVHMSVISIEGEKRYTNGCLQSHYVSSDIGCNLRQYGSFDAPVIAILDTYTSLTVLSRDESTGFNYVEVNLDDGTALNGYVHSSVICSLK